MTLSVHGSTPVAHSKLVDALRGRRARGSRAGEMREALGAVAHSNDPRERYLWRDDSWNLAFQLQEHWAYWAGANPGWVQRYNTAMEEWMEDGELPGSAYGDRMRNTAGHDQLGRVLDQLSDRPETRRAMIMVHQADVEDYDGGDVACTAYLHPFVRDGKLHMTAALRSQDMHWGYAYDAANNQFVQEVLAERLGVSLGSYRHFMDSCHYYTEYEDDVVASLDAGLSLKGPSLDLPDSVPWDMEFLDLTVALKAARSDRTAMVDTVVRDYMKTDFCKDWALVMTAYELERFHGKPCKAGAYARRVGDNGWGTWIRDYVEEA